MIREVLAFAEADIRIDHHWEEKHEQRFRAMVEQPLPSNWEALKEQIFFRLEHGEWAETYFKKKRDQREFVERIGRREREIAAGPIYHQTCTCGAIFADHNCEELLKRFREHAEPLQHWRFSNDE